MFKKTVLIAAAFATTIALMPAEADAGSKTRHFIGGVAAGVGGLLLLDTLNRPRRSSRHYAPRHRYYKPAPRYRYYEPVNHCRSTRSALRKLRHRGFHNFHNIRYRTYSTKVKAWRGGVHYKIKLNSCSGRMIWSQAI